MKPTWISSAKATGYRGPTSCGGRSVTLALLLFLSGSCRTASAEEPWKVEIVDAGLGRNVGTYTSMVIDHAGNFHIGYHDEGGNALRYAFRGAHEKDWHSMQVDAGGAGLSLTVDKEGNPHFAYVGPNENGLRYAHWDGTRWQKQIIDPERIAFFLSIQLNSQGLPRISYYQRLWADGTYALHLKYASFDGKAWYTETVDADGATGKFNSLALDGQDHPHISYSEVNEGDLRYAYFDGSDWQISKPETHRGSGGWVGLASCIIIDRDGYPNIAYLAVDKRQVKYARRTKRGWQIQVVDQLVGRADNIDRLSLKLDSQGRPNVVYYDSGLGMLKYGVRTAESWRIERVDPSVRTGLYPSLFLGKADEPYVSYYDMANGALRFAQRIASAVPPLSTNNQSH